ncbi:hypothetical protein FPOAC2_00222 [Fusarium poae]
MPFSNLCCWRWPFRRRRSWDSETSSSPNELVSTSGSTHGSSSRHTVSDLGSVSDESLDHCLNTMGDLEDEPDKIEMPSPPPSQFISHLLENSSMSTQELMKPYLSYERFLRKEFAKVRRLDSPIPIDHLDNLVPVFADPRIHTSRIDRDNKKRRRKYMMKLPSKIVGDHGSLAITPTLEEYRERFDAFTFGTLAGLADIPNIVVGGSAALLPLLPRRNDVRGVPEPSTVARPWETYYQHVAKSSDVDIFMYGIDKEKAIDLIYRIEREIRNIQGLKPGTGLSLRSEHAITFIAPKWPFRHIQIILRLYKSLSEILTGFDVDCSCVAFDGKQVYSTPRGVAAIATRTNIIDLTRRSPSYENRLWKYRQHNFDVYWEHLRRDLIDVEVTGDDRNVKGFKGLARLLFSEETLRLGLGTSYLGTYWFTRALMRIGDSNDASPSAPSGYATFDVPYGQHFDAEWIREYVRSRTDEAFFGTIEEVINGLNAVEEGKEFMARKLSFIEDDPGRQMIGSTHPLDADDWTTQAYKSPSNEE